MQCLPKSLVLHPDNVSLGGCIPSQSAFSSDCTASTAVCLGKCTLNLEILGMVKLSEARHWADSARPRSIQTCCGPHFGFLPALAMDGVRLPSFAQTLFVHPKPGLWSWHSHGNWKRFWLWMVECQVRCKVDFSSSLASEKKLHI